MIGQVVKGKYKIYDEVGSGGFAAVYLGRNMETNEIVAIKILSRQYTSEPRYVERFRREAGLAERLKHPNVVRIFDHGIEDGQHFLVMEFVEGLTLDRLIQRNGVLSIEQTISFTEQACAGLQAAYQAGVVHRDIKPANLMITPDGVVKIMDFGIARMEALAGLTQSGIFMGTPRYISPEMARGSRADTRSDLYALGLLAYEMLAGAPPFDAENPWAVLRQQIESDPAPLGKVRSDVPTWLEAIIFKAVAKEPGQRFQTPAEMLGALQQQTSSPDMVHQAAPPMPLADATLVAPAMPKRGMPKGLIYGLIGAVLLVAVAVVSIMALGGFGEKSTPTPTPTEAVALAPTDTATATPLPTFTPVVVVITNTPAPTTTPAPTSTDTPTPMPTDTPVPTDTPSPVPTDTPLPTDTPVPEPTDTPIPPTRGPTNTPRPTEAPTSPPAPAITGRITYSAGGLLHIVDAASGSDIVSPIANMGQPDFRTDGQLIIAKGFQGDKTSLWTINANSGSFVRQQSTFTNDYHPFWSPDGSRFAYDSLHLNEKDLILYWNSLDTQVDNIVRAEDQPTIGTSPVWMHDDWLAFTGCDYWPGGTAGSKCGIYRMPSWGGRPAMVKQGSLTMRATDSYGAQLVYMSQDSGDWEVYVIPSQGGTPSNLSNSSSSQDGLGTFSPDGKLVAFASNRGGSWAIWAVKLDGSSLTKLFNLPAPPTGTWTEEHISWGP